MKTVWLFLMTATSLLVAAPQAVVFDFGGVLASPDRKIVERFLCDSLNLNLDQLKYTAKSEREAAIKKGVPQADFWQQYAKKEGIELPENWKITFSQILENSLGIDSEMFAIINQLQEQGIVIGLLSNIGQGYASMIKEFGYYHSFDPCLLSYEIGVEKPDAKAYQILLEKVAVHPSDIVFIDDKPENIEAAKKAGLDAFLFESPKQVRKELKQRGLL